MKNFCLSLQKHYRSILSYGFTVIFCLFCLFVLYSFITAPFTGDLQVFMAAANQVKYQSSGGLMAVFEAWELKGICNRVFMWLIYYIADLTGGYENKIAFTYVAKSVYALFAIAVSVMIVHLWPAEDLKQKRYGFFAIFLSVFATFTSVQMQAEMTCVLIALLCTACILHGKKRSLITAGILAATLVFYKSIFILFFAVIVLGALLYDGKVFHNKQRLWLPFGCMGTCQILFFLLVKLVYPQEFSDMRLAAELQRTLLSAGSSTTLQYISDHFITDMTMTAAAIPLLMAGFAAGILLLFIFGKRKEYGRIGLLLILWLIPIDLIVLSNLYFQYHYYMLMLPGLISIITLLKYEQIPLISIFIAALLAGAVTLANNILGIVNFSLILLVIVHIALLAVVVGLCTGDIRIRNIFHIFTLAVCLFFWLSYDCAISNKHNNLVDLQKQSVSVCSSNFPDDFGDAPVLFLDGGTAPFYADAPSYSRYFFNLPMQRWSVGKDWPIQQAEYEKMLAYQGKYIVFSSWFGIEKYPDLVQKLNEEYEPLSNGGLYFHSPDWNLLQTVPVPDAASIAADTSCAIYIRKEIP